MLLVINFDGNKYKLSACTVIEEGKHFFTLYNSQKKPKGVTIRKQASNNNNSNLCRALNPGHMKKNAARGWTKIWIGVSTS